MEEIGHYRMDPTSESTESKPSLPPSAITLSNESIENTAIPQVRPNIFPPFPPVQQGGPGGIASLASIGHGVKFAVALKKKEVPKSLKDIITYDPNNQWKQSIEERMRYLDTIHKYTPLPEECDELHISSQRYDLHAMKTVLELSGACIGVRFQTQELQHLPIVFSQLNTSYDLLDTEYKKFPSKWKKLKFKSISSSMFQNNKYIELVQNMPIAEFVNLYKTSTDSIIAYLELTTYQLIEEFVMELNSSLGSSISSSTSSDSASQQIVNEQDQMKMIINGHILLDRYAFHLSQIQKFIIDKQKEIPPPAERCKFSLYLYIYSIFAFLSNIGCICVYIYIYCHVLRFCFIFKKLINS